MPLPFLILVKNIAVIFFWIFRRKFNQTWIKIENAIFKCLKLNINHKEIFLLVKFFYDSLSFILKSLILIFYLFFYTKTIIIQHLNINNNPDYLTRPKFTTAMKNILEKYSDYLSFPRVCGSDQMTMRFEHWLKSKLRRK